MESKDKQIAEMDCKKCLHYESCQIAFRNSKSLSIYEEDYDEEQYFADTIDCDYYVDKNIYRKSTDVAREIFEEIVTLMNEVYSSVQYGCYSYGTTKDIDSPSAQRQCGKLEGVKYLGDKIAELKKKYGGL